MNNEKAQLTWNNFHQFSEDVQERMLEEMGFKSLSALPWKKQAELFDGAPVDVMLTYFKDLHWKAQVKVWDNYLPASAEPYLVKALKDAAAIKLGLKPKPKAWKKYTFMS